MRAGSTVAIPLVDFATGSSDPGILVIAQPKASRNFLRAHSPIYPSIRPPITSSPDSLLQSHILNYHLGSFGEHNYLILPIHPPSYSSILLLRPLHLHHGLVLGRRRSCARPCSHGTSSLCRICRHGTSRQRPPSIRQQLSLTSVQSACPMHKKSLDALTPTNEAKCQKPTNAPAASGCPVPHDARTSTETPKSIMSQLNPLNYMFPDLSQKPAPNQKYKLPTERDESTIPKGSGDGNWEYPSPQQMYNALLRKGHTDTDITAVEGMVSVHNYLNEGAWMEILEWEKRFGRGLYKGWQVCRRGEEHVPEELDRHWDGTESAPTLERFQGRPKDMTPKATMLQVLGWVYPSKFG